MKEKDPATVEEGKREEIVSNLQGDPAVSARNGGREKVCPRPPSRTWLLAGVYRLSGQING